MSRAEHLNVILDRYEEKAMTDIFYMLVNNTSYGGEGSPEFYGKKLRFTPVSDDDDDGKVHIAEKDIDSMLLLFSQICHEHERGTISDAEFDFFSYQIRRTLAHRQFKQYLFDFAEYCGKYKVGYPYLALAREGVKVDGPHYDNVLALVDKKRIGILNKLKEALP